MDTVSKNKNCTSNKRIRIMKEAVKPLKHASKVDYEQGLNNVAFP
jgi:hypothetical protein